MFDATPSHSLNLMHEVASVAALQGCGSVSVRLVHVNVARVRFLSSERLPSGPSDQLSMRFTLPGNPRLHFAMVRLLAMTASDASGCHYEAEFVRTDPKTVDHIIQLLGSNGPLSADDGGVLHASSYQLSSMEAEPEPGGHYGKQQS